MSGLELEQWTRQLFGQQGAWSQPAVIPMDAYRQDAADPGSRATQATQDRGQCREWGKTAHRVIS
jgi:hypothetical protein